MSIWRVNFFLRVITDISNDSLPGIVKNLSEEISLILRTNISIRGSVYKDQRFRRYRWSLKLKRTIDVMYLIKYIWIHLCHVVLSAPFIVQGAHCTLLSILVSVILAKQY